jgi:CRP/FNR family cyclic AMP-dependent transcriptional regulator
MLQPVPLTANCLIKTDHFGTALTCRLDGLDVHSNCLVKLGHLDFNTGHYSTYDVVFRHLGHRASFRSVLGCGHNRWLIVSILSVGRWQSAMAMTKKAKKVPFDSKVFLATVNGGRSISTYRANQKVFSQGKSADAVFYIQKGKVKITVVSEQGKEAVVAVLGPDEFCGEGCLNGQLVRLATATAITECEIMRLEKAAMVRVLHEEPAFSEMFVSHLLARTIRVEADLVDQLFNSSEKRLARALLLLANFGKDGRPEPIIAKVSQETLAEMIGTTRSRVSFFMNKFRKLGLIDYNGQIEIHTSLLNVVLHEEPHINR